MSVKGIDNCLEVLAALGEGGSVFQAVMADGKVNFLDIPKLFSLLGPVKLAVEGASEIPAEFADLSPDEITQLAEAAYAAVMKWVGK